MGDAYTNSNAVSDDWSKKDADAIFAATRALSASLPDFDPPGSIVITSDQLASLVKSCSPEQRAAIFGPLATVFVNGIRLEVASSEEAARKRRIALAAEEEMRHDLIGTGIMQSIGRQSFDEAAMPRVGTVPLNRQQRRAAERAARKRR